MSIQRYEYEPHITKKSGLFIIDVDVVDNIPYEVKEKSVVKIPPEEMGGNHKHPRWEALIGIGQGLVLIWQEDDGTKKEEKMNPDEKLYLFVIPPYIPHTVINTSDVEFGILVEYASAVQHDVEPVDLVSKSF